MLFRKAIVIDIEVKVVGLWPETSRIEAMIGCCFLLTVQHLYECLLFSCCIHGNTRNECKGLRLFSIHHFEIPAFEIFFGLAPALKLFGVEEGFEFSY